MIDPESAFEMLFDLTMMQRSELTTLEGGLLLRHHPKAVCSGRCPLHFPTDHAMATWPMKWNDARGIMERVCGHGVAHADPDDLKVWRLSALYAAHECDGCCFDVDYWSQGLEDSGGSTRSMTP